MGRSQHHRWSFLGLGLLLVATPGCGEQEGECLDNAMCPAGEVCFNGSCRTAECTTSDTCGVGQYCDPRGYVCKAGCLQDGDCQAGQECDRDNKVCVERACRTTELDCAVGEFCDATSGECYEADPPVCQKTCDVAATSSGCPTGTRCEVTTITTTCSTDSSCPAGYRCDLFTDGNKYCHQDFCLSTCNANDADACPAGFSCIQGSFSSVCYGDCGWYTDNGYL